MNSKFAAFVLVKNGDGEEPQVMSSGIYTDIEEAIDDWVDPMIGWVPDHMENILDSNLVEDRWLTAVQFEKLRKAADGSEEWINAKAKLRHASLVKTRRRFGIGCVIDEELDTGEYVIVETRLDGTTITYPDRQLVRRCPQCGCTRLRLECSGDFVQTLVQDETVDIEYGSVDTHMVTCDSCYYQNSSIQVFNPPE